MTTLPTASSVSPFVDPLAPPATRLEVKVDRLAAEVVELRAQVSRLLEIAGRQRPRRRPTPRRRNDLPITDAEKHAGELFVELGGNISDIARRLGISRAAVRDRLKALWRKACGAGVGDTVQFMRPSYPKKQRLPTDGRGQVTTLPPKRGRGRKGRGGHD
jgi:hypothetical protein